MKKTLNSQTRKNSFSNRAEGTSSRALAPKARGEKPEIVNGKKTMPNTISSSSSASSAASSSSKSTTINSSNSSINQTCSSINLSQSLSRSSRTVPPFAATTSASTSSSTIPTVSSSSVSSIASSSLTTNEATSSSSSSSSAPTSASTSASTSKWNGFKIPKRHPEPIVVEQPTSSHGKASEQRRRHRPNNRHRRRNDYNRGQRSLNNNDTNNIFINNNNNRLDDNLNNNFNISFTNRVSTRTDEHPPRSGGVVATSVDRSRSRRASRGSTALLSGVTSPSSAVGVAITSDRPVNNGDGRNRYHRTDFTSFRFSDPNNIRLNRPNINNATSTRNSNINHNINRSNTSNNNPNTDEDNPLALIYNYFQSQHEGTPLPPSYLNRVSELLGTDSEDSSPPFLTSAPSRNTNLANAESNVSDSTVNQVEPTTTEPYIPVSVLPSLPELPEETVVVEPDVIIIEDSSDSVVNSSGPVDNVVKPLNSLPTTLITNSLTKTSATDTSLKLIERIKIINLPAFEGFKRAFHLFLKSLEPLFGRVVRVRINTPKVKPSLLSEATFNFEDNKKTALALSYLNGFEWHETKLIALAADFSNNTIEPATSSVSLTMLKDKIACSACGEKVDPASFDSHLSVCKKDELLPLYLDAKKAIEEEKVNALSSTEATSQVEPLLNQFMSSSCPVCQEPFAHMINSKYITLPCNHHLCSSCYQALIQCDNSFKGPTLSYSISGSNIQISVDSREAVYIKCPLCRNPTSTEPLKEHLGPSTDDYPRTNFLDNIRPSPFFYPGQYALPERGNIVNGRPESPSFTIVDGYWID